MGLDWQIRAWLTAASAHFGERPDSVSAGVPAAVELLYLKHGQDAGPCGSRDYFVQIWTIMCLDIL